MSASQLADTFNSTSNEFDSVTPAVWGPAGQTLSFALDLRAGESVLDVCAGTGASALPAAMAVGPSGTVHAIDLADDLLAVARAKAAASALQNVEFVCADATQWQAPSTIDGGYDALSCSYGIFFLPDMDVSFARLVGLVRPRGRVGVTVWRKGAIETFGAAFFDVVARYAPEVAHSGPRSKEGYASHPIRRVETAESLTAWLQARGCESVRVQELSNHVPTTDVFAWNFVLGSGFRGALNGFDEKVSENIRREFLELLAARGIDSVDASTLVATGIRAS